MFLLVEVFWLCHSVTMLYSVCLPTLKAEMLKPARYAVTGTFEIPLIANWCIWRGNSLFLHTYTFKKRDWWYGHVAVAR